MRRLRVVPRGIIRKREESKVEELLKKVLYFCHKNTNKNVILFILK